MKRISLLIGILFAIVLLSACGDSDEDYLLESINEKVTYFNATNEHVFMYSEQNEYFDDIENLEIVSSFEDITLFDGLNIIAVDTEYMIPTENQLLDILDLFENNSEEQFITVCFFSVNGYSFLDGYFIVGSSNPSGTISLCFGNYEGSTNEYDLEIIDYRFEDIADNHLLYTDIILKYIQRQNIKYYDYIG